MGDGFEQMACPWCSKEYVLGLSRIAGLALTNRACCRYRLESFLRAHVDKCTWRLKDKVRPEDQVRPEDTVRPKDKVANKDKVRPASQVDGLALLAMVAASEQLETETH